MRIIAGIAKNRKLKAPSGHNTRPITDMIKEALFNVLGAKTKDANFLDLFAGSGSVGIEALSRGAKLVIFIDNDNAAVKVIKSNLEHCNFTSGFEVYKNDVFKALNILEKRKLAFNIIYVDPPFTKTELFEQVMISLDSKFKLIAKEGLIIIRTPSRYSMPDEYSNLIKCRYDEYGESALHYYIVKS